MYSYRILFVLESSDHVWNIRVQSEYEIKSDKHFTLFTSLFSASFGIARFLKTDPCKLLPDDGLLGGTTFLKGYGRIYKHK